MKNIITWIRFFHIDFSFFYINMYIQYHIKQNTEQPQHNNHTKNIIPIYLNTSKVHNISMNSLYLE